MVINNQINTAKVIAIDLLKYPQYWGEEKHIFTKKNKYNMLVLKKIFSEKERILPV
jgi:hypothetical protein